MIHTQLKEDLKQAMRARDQIKLSAIRGILSMISAELINKKSSAEIMPDEEVLAIIRKGVKQRKDSIEQFIKGGREDLADTERKEMSILDGYLPTLMSIDEIRKVARIKKEELNITDKNKMGLLMGTIMKELKGKADGNDVKKVVEELF